MSTPDSFVEPTDGLSVRRGRLGAVGCLTLAGLSTSIPYSFVEPTDGLSVRGDRLEAAGIGRFNWGCPNSESVWDLCNETWESIGECEGSSSCPRELTLVRLVTESGK